MSNTDTCDCTENGCDDCYQRGYNDGQDATEAEFDDFIDPTELETAAVAWLCAALSKRGFNVLEEMSMRWDAPARVLIVKQGVLEAWVK